MRGVLCPASWRRSRPAAANARPVKPLPIDFTGYWVSVVSEDWRWRMVTPAKGDFASIPVNAGSAAESASCGIRRRTKLRDEFARPMAPRPSCDCRAGLHITWQDDSTLKIETDTGPQTRLLNFDGKPADD